MKIGILMLRHAPVQKSSVTRDVIRLLTEWDAQVDVIYPEEQLVTLSHVHPEYDLYVLKSRTDMALGLAGALHASGAAILNPYPVSALLRDRIATTRYLQAAGIPTPETYVTAHPERLTPLLDDGPVAVKPHRGSGARGVHVVWDADELDDVPTNQGPILAQRLVERAGYARKIYCVGGQLFGVRKVWPARTYEEKVGEAFTIAPKLRDIALRCGRAFGIEVYGLDIIGTDENPFVVDVRSFPDFKGVPDAALRVADYIYHACQRVVNGLPVLPAPGKEVGS